MRCSWFGLGFILLRGCSSERDRPPYYEYEPAATSGGSGYDLPNQGDCEELPPTDAGLCGNDVIAIQEDRPNLYFILDASGSMGEDIAADSKETKYHAAVSAIIKVLRAIGHRVSYGAALFPDPAADACVTGKEVFETQAGDPITCALSGRSGSVLTKLVSRLSPPNFAPAGGTPLSATLSALVPTLTALRGKTAVILATDGAPNCNPNATCTREYCETNLVRWQYPSGLLCDESVNCCDPTFDSNGPLNCVDNVATNELLASLNAAAIPTYVIGLPSESLLGSVLDSMAVAGGTAREQFPRYYETADAQGLADTLKRIATSIAVSCTIKLGHEPPNWAQVAVYLDNTRIPTQSDDGWRQVDTHTIEITGSYCDDLMTGDVMRVQIASGCPVYVN